MKKTVNKSLALLLAAVMLFGASPIIGIGSSLIASAASVSDLTFVLINSDTAYEVSNCNASASGDLTIPATYNGKPVTGIGNEAFADCSTLVSVTVPVGVTKIGDSAFLGCDALERVTVYEGVTSIGNMAFGNCYNLEKITIPMSVTSIGENAFANCSSFESVTIPMGVTSIGDYAFSNCVNMASVTISSSVMKIGTNAFNGTKVYNTAGNWTNQVLYIDNCLIKAQSGIASCDVIAGTRLIADNALFNLNNLTSVTIPESVTSIGVNAFDSCGRLEAISVDSSNAHYSSVAGVLFSKDKKVLICYPKGKAGTSYSIPNGVTSIADNAFYYCQSLTSVTIPSGLTSIGEYAFYYCDSLENINIPNSVTNISNYAFGGTEYFDNNDNWINDVLYIDNCLISGKSVLTSCVITEGTRLIADNALVNLNNLASVTIPNSVSNIGDGVFFNCKSLRSVTIPDAVTSIGDYLFYDCSNLMSVYIPNGVSSIGVKAFYNCESLKSVTIPDGMTSIGEYLFYNCSSLESVTIPESVTSIGCRAFQFCVKMTDVYYGGDESDKAAIEVGSDNGSLVNATWHCSVKVSGVTVSPTRKTLAVGATQQLTETIAPDNANNKAVTWTSSNVNVATVDENGLVAAIAAGTAIITVKTADGNKTANCAITVIVPVTGVTLDITSKTIAIGATQQLTATVAPTNATNKAVVWTSTNTAIATVSATGLVTAKASGATTIIVTTADGSKFAVCTITVAAPVTVAGVTLDMSNKTLAVGGEQQLTATVIPGDAANKAVKWTSSNTAIVTVDENGLVSAIAAGTATITVTTADGGKTATCVITVVVPVTGVTLDITSKTLIVGATQQLAKTVTPENATNKNVTWASSNTSVATVNDNGLVTAISTGTATITVTAENGNKTATCAVTVRKPAVVKVEIQTMPNDLTYTYKKDSFKKAGLTIVVTYENGKKDMISDTEKIDVIGFDINQKGEQKLTVEYSGVQAEEKITVKVEYTFLQWLIVIILFGWIWY